MEENLFKKTADPVCVDALDYAAQITSNTVNELQEHLTETRRLARILEDLKLFRDRLLPLHIKSLCEREKEFLKALRGKNHPAITVIEDLYREMDSRSGILIREIPYQLEQLAKSSGLTLDFSRSLHPRYYFELGGFIEVEVKDKKMEAKVCTREGILAKIPADAVAIIDLVKQEKKRLFERPFTGSRLLADMRIAYSSAIKTNKGTEGDPIPIRTVHDFMTRKIKDRKGYKSDEFLVDLSKLVLEGPGETKGYRFELQQTKDIQEGMLLLGEAGRGMVNLLIFKQANSQEP